MIVIDKQGKARRNRGTVGLVTSIAATRPVVAGGSSTRAVLLASFVGTAIEWYDFFLYGTAAALVFSQLFFPKIDPLAGTMAAFATFAVGFFARPIGGDRLRSLRRPLRPQVDARLPRS